MGFFRKSKAWTWLRYASITLLLLALSLWGLLSYKNHLQKNFSELKFRSLQIHHPPFRDLFQTSFYFYYEDQFLPEVKSRIKEAHDLRRILYIDNNSKILFDSESVLSQGAGGFDVDIGIKSQLTSGNPWVRIQNFQTQVLMPAGPFSVLYVFYSENIFFKIIILSTFLLIFIPFLVFLFFNRDQIRVSKKNLERLRNLIGLRSKFILTIILINLITGGIVFFTLVELQTKEQTDRIRKESLLFGQFSTQQIVNNFSNYFYFYFQDKFIPSINTIIATNENLLGIRIISYRSRKILFDSRDANQSPVPESDQFKIGYELKGQEEAILRSRGVVSRDQWVQGNPQLSVINRYTNENQEVLFLVEYVFGYQSLARMITSIRRQILLDLVPSMLLGLIIALAFAQFLISPIRKLARALKKVSSGDYEVSIDLKRSDEIGELLSAFNDMTLELRKKTELRKYLSDTTYRHIMESPEILQGEKLKGIRVNAAILFSDIRSFVSHCENLDAEEITSMLNEYFNEMVEVVYHNGGEVDKFIGDAILAVFYPNPNLNESDSDTALRAIYCGLEMQERLRHYNKRRRSMQKKVIEIGVGISFGEIISGPIGSQDRRDFTVIGDVVNLASRIEKLSKKGKHTKILFSNHIENKIQGLLDYEEIETGRIRGKEEVVHVYELIQIKKLGIILENIHSENQALKIRSIELLGHSLNQESITPLLGLINDQEVSVRLQATESLKMLSGGNNSTIVDAFFERLKIEKISKVKSKLISAIGQIEHTEKLLGLEPFLKSDDDRIIANTIEALGQYDHPSVSDLVLPFLGSVHNRIKANAAMILFSSGKAGVLDTLKPMLLHSDHLMRSSAAFAIGELTLLAKKERFLDNFSNNKKTVQPFLANLQECVPMLVTLIKDQEMNVRRQAVIALGKIRDRSAVLPLIDALTFDEKSKHLLTDISNAVNMIGAHKLVRDIIEKMS